MKILLLLHPIIQLSAILLAYYAGYLGLQRTRSLHFGHRVLFQRKRHAATGAVALVVLMCGYFGGLILASAMPPGHEGGEIHEIVGTILLPLFVIGGTTGYYLYSIPKKNKTLAIIHGLNNLVILILLLVQIFSGWHILKEHVLGG